MRIAEAGVTGCDPASLDPLWAKFEALIKGVEGLGTFPFEPIADALTEVGAFINSAAFDQLYEVLTDALATRKSEGEAAERNTQRGFQKLKMDLPYEAIRWFGRAVGLLTKSEYQDELVEALIGSSFAYEDAGLHWAARNYALAAASQEFHSFRRTGSLDGVAPSTLKRWMITELPLGRVPYILTAHQLTGIVLTNRAVSDEQRAHAEEELLQSMMWIGALLLRTRPEDLGSLLRFPDGLDRMQLGHARMAILYLLGEMDVLRAEGSIPENETDEGAEEFFQQWSAFAHEMPLPEHPDYALGDRVELRSRVLGCDLTINCANNLTSISIGEALLGTLEALLATSLKFRIMPTLDRLTIRIDPVPGAELTPKIEFSHDGTPTGSITHRPELHYASYEEALTFPNWLQAAAVETFTTFAVPTEVEQWGEEVLGNEKGFSRAVTFSNIPSMMSLLLGNQSRISSSDWEEHGDRTYTLCRDTAWIGSEPLKPEKQQRQGPPKLGEGEPPAEMFDFERLKHTNFRIVSPIDVRKWDAAGWKGVFFLVSPGNPDFRPVMGIAFSNMEAGEGIFRGLRDRLGIEDVNDELRIAITRGARISNPHAYGVSIGSNMSKLPSSEGEIVEFTTRNHILTPTTSANLERFLSSYAEHGRYLLVPAKFNGVTVAPEPNLDLAIGKHELVVRQGWEIGTNDPDVSILDEDDPPVVPMDVSDPPALKALDWIAKMRKRGDQG
jgi:hypothetical protein